MVDKRLKNPKILLILENTSGIFLHRERQATNMEQKSPKDIQEPNKPSVPEPTKFPGIEGAFFSTQNQKVNVAVLKRFGSDVDGCPFQWWTKGWKIQKPCCF